ncbi:MAG: PIG-L family deacetylase [Aeromicrobium erythreum]
MTAPASATRWDATLRDAALPTVDDPGGPVVVLSAHPDDEVLGVGAWLAGQVDRRLHLVVATDGEQSHPGSPTVTPDQLRTVRRRELAEALAVLGHPQVRTTHLGLRDAALPDDREPLTRLLQPLLQDAAVVLAPYEHDGHGDHDVLGAVARELVPAGTTLWRYPVWRWTRSTPDVGADWLQGAALLPSSAGAAQQKAAALRAFRSQLEPWSDHPADQVVVTPALLEHALTAPEVVLT